MYLQNIGNNFCENKYFIQQLYQMALQASA